MARKPAAKKPSTAPAPQPARRGRDIRPYIYLALNQIFALAYFYVVIAAIPNRVPTAKVNLSAVPVLMQLIALGAASVFVPVLRRAGWWLVVVGSSLLVGVTIVLIARVLISAAFLSGVYGAFG
jgi:riboflavin transporter FmnP